MTQPAFHPPTSPSPTLGLLDLPQSLQSKGHPTARPGCLDPNPEWNSPASLSAQCLLLATDVKCQQT